MPLVIHQPQAEMGGGQVIRVSNHDRTTRWVTFHFDSEADGCRSQASRGCPFEGRES
jgi:hypothetical protein